MVYSALKRHLLSLYWERVSQVHTMPSAHAQTTKLKQSYILLQLTSFCLTTKGKGRTSSYNITEI